MLATVSCPIPIIFIFIEACFFFKNQDLYKDFPEYVNHLYFNRVGVTTAQDYDYKTVTRRSMVEQQTQNNTFVLPIVLGWPKPEGGDPSSFLMLASLNDFPMERMVNIGTFIEIQTLKKKKKKKENLHVSPKSVQENNVFWIFHLFFFFFGFCDQTLRSNLKVENQTKMHAHICISIQKTKYLKTFCNCETIWCARLHTVERLKIWKQSERNMGKDTPL